MKITIVTADLAGLTRNSGVGTACYHVAMTLSKIARVRLLFAPRNREAGVSIEYWQAHFQERGIELSILYPPQLPFEHAEAFPVASMEAYFALRESRDDVIIFNDMQGLGHFTILAKSSGLEFQSTRIVVLSHGTTAWHLEKNQERPASLDGLAIQFMERACLRGADAVLFATPSAYRDALATKSVSRDRAKRIDLYPFEKIKPARHRQRLETQTRLREICFFGRIETRKGVELFLSALEPLSKTLLKEGISISLLGSLAKIKGAEAGAYLARWSRRTGMELKVYNRLDHFQAQKVLRRPGLLAVLPSRAETMSYSLIECLESRIPFVCSDIPAHRDVLRQFGVGHSARLFGNQAPAALTRSLKSAIKNGIAPARVRPGVQEQSERSLIRAIRGVRLQKARRGTDRPSSIAVCIPHRNRIRDLEALLRKLHASKDRFDEILVYDDWSRPDVRSRLRDLVSRYQKTVVLLEGDAHVGVSGARNRLAAAATSEHLFFLDDDNRPAAGLVGDLRLILRAKPDVVVSTLIKFNAKTGRDLHYWFPVGDSLLINTFQNVIGDANFCVRRDLFIRIGGFDESFRYGEDHEFLLRAAERGAKIQICPRPLVRYAVRSPAVKAALGRRRDLSKLRNILIDRLRLQISSKDLRHLKHLASKPRQTSRWSTELAPLPPTARWPSPAISLRQRGWLRSAFANRFITTKGVTRLEMRSGQLKPLRGPQAGTLDFDLVVLAPSRCSLRIAETEAAIQLMPGANRLRVRVVKGSPLRLEAMGPETFPIYVASVEVAGSKSGLKQSKRSAKRS